MTDEAQAPANPKNQPTVGPKKFNPKLLLRIVWSMLRRRWLCLGIAFIVSLVFGGIGSGPLTKKTWKATAVLLYTPPTIPESVETIASSVSLANVAGFANTEPVLKQIKENLELPFPATLLNQALKVESSRNTSTVFFALTWGDREEAQKILEQLMIVYPEYTAKVRQQIAESMLKETEKQIQEVKSRQTAARNRYRDFTRENNIVDFKKDLVLMQTKILSLESKLSQAKRDEQTLGDQVDMLDKHIQSIRKEQEAEAEAAKDFEAAEETLADNRRRQNRLRELIDEERRMLEIKSQIDVKKREYERARLLHEKSLIPASKLEKVRGELESLIAKVTESESVTRWKHELEELDKLVVPKNKNNKKGSPIIQQILFKKLETQLSIAQQQKAQVELEREISATKSQIATFQRLRGDLQSLEDDMAAIDAERLAIEDKASVLRQLANSGPMEFSVVSPPSAGEFPVSNNRKTMFLGVVILVLFLTGTSIAAFDVLLCGLVPPDVQVEMLGLPIISKHSNPSAAHGPDQKTDSESGPEQPYDDEMRNFALQLRQRFPDAGTVLMLCEMNQTPQFDELVKKLSCCLAARDERVLILDARKTEDGLGSFSSLIDSNSMIDRVCESERPMEQSLPGLRDWLTFHCDLMCDIILPTQLTGVDCILPGSHGTTEEFATIRMNELIEYARENYTLTILLSPDSTCPTELQILSAYTDGIAMTFEPTSYVEADTGSTIRTLLDIEAPLIGAIQV